MAILGNVMMSAMWKYAFLASEGPSVFVAFVIAAQLACGVTVVDEWATLTLPRPDTSQWLRSAIASLDGKTQEGMSLNHLWVWLGKFA